MVDDAAQSKAPLSKRVKVEASKQNSTCTQTTWLRTLEIYVKDSGVSLLKFSGSKIEFEVLKSVLKFLEDSQVTKLALENQRWSLSEEDMKCFCDLLLKTKITSLKIQKCNLSYEHLSTLIDTFKNSNIVEFDLIVNPEYELSINTKKMLLSGLQQSRLSSLRLQNIFDDFGSLLEGTELNSSLTCLNLSNFKGDPSVFGTLFSKLPCCSIKDLDLSYNKLGEDLMKKLSQNLKDSKVEKLNLGFNYFMTASFDTLALGLVDSRVMELDLRCNGFIDFSKFGECLKRTKIRVLNLSENRDTSRDHNFSFPDSLKDSLVESLDLSKVHIWGKIGAELMRSLKSTKLSTLYLSHMDVMATETILEFPSALKDTNLKTVDFSFNKLPEEVFGVLCEYLDKSKLESIKLDGPKSLENFSGFWEGIKNSSIHSVHVRNLTLSADHAKILAETGISTNIKCLNFSSSRMDDDFMTLFAPLLKSTSITFLRFPSCNINDVDLQILAQHLRETRVSELDLKCNKITCGGAKMLAIYCPKTSLIRIDLSFNCIEKTDDLEILAEYFAESLVVNLNCHSLGKTLLFDEILMKNRILAHDLVTFFKEISPESSNGNFRFHQCINKEDVTDFLEKCLKFFKRVLEQPAVISTFLHEESITFSRGELVTLLFENFPRQLVVFISEWIEADVAQHVAFLNRAEELGLGKFVEILLLTRPLLMIDEAHGILHPCVYPLLLKYELPICNEAVEPEGIAKIVKYFTEHPNIEGSADVIGLLTKEKAA